MMDFRVRQLQYFLVLAEHLNFNRAARELQIPQPTLSFQIKSLEAALDVRLFDRNQRHVQLTSSGVRLRKHARTILKQAHRAILDIQH